jgi:hypothetical protein
LLARVCDTGDEKYEPMNALLFAYSNCTEVALLLYMPCKSAVVEVMSFVGFAIGKV